MTGSPPGTAGAVLASWSLDPWLAGLLVAATMIYLRGWRGLHRRRPHAFGVGRLVAWVAGVIVVYTAIASPIDAFGSLLLQVHMLQHLLLMLVAPPLLLLAWPAIPMLRGLPATVRRQWIGPFLAWPTLRRAFTAMTHPAVAWLAFVACFWMWHLPALYELALVSPTWHRIEHAMFLGTGVLFWWPVVRPYPFRPQWPRWTMVPYLLAASVQNTIFSAIFCFADRVLYPLYEQAPRVTGLTALQDQAAAGALMWVPGSILMLIPAGWITYSLVSPSPRRPRTAPRRRPAGDTGFDLLRLAPFLASRRVRLGLRALMLLLAAAIVLDGLLGPQVASMNLAGVLPWTHWRGLVVIGLLVAGNFFCMTCPFLLPRMIGRRLLPATRPWPRVLRSKWLAIGLLVTYLVCYEVFDLWASPWWTAWIILGYFVAATAIDGVFRDASFCKYVCPIGQFHFVQSMLSPLEVKVREPETCVSCRTFDCIRGGPDGPGCETHLFQPRKVGNLDCTFCLDCVSACPHDNVGILGRVPGSELVDDRRRSSVRRLWQRPDVAALIVVLVFGAFANAAGMIGPVLRWEDAAVASTGLPLWAVTTLMLVGLTVIAPALLVGGAAAVSRAAISRFAPALVPMGFAMWLSHMVFHLVTGWGAAVPVMQRAAGVGEPAWSMSHAMTQPAWLVPMELAMLGIGLVVAVAATWFIAMRLASRPARALRMALPWAAIAIGLYLVGVWIVLEPMEMRGTMMMEMPG